ncbi:MAG TPA: cell wall hydrolase, partial [Burkholderiales bacterium]|nr:cell wall hydrolase [Burkholderiales bacterium]
MPLASRLEHLRWRLSGAGADARRALRLAWYRADREAMAFALMIGAVLVVLGFGLHAVFDRHLRTAALAREQEARNLECLALNVYYEARGEPRDGQYAVAEVTMNRLASSRYPDSVCAVVHEQRWDELRGRYVAAFSWTEFYSVPEPEGEAWVLAQKVASDVYHGRAAPRAEGATFYHS